MKQFNFKTTLLKAFAVIALCLMSSSASLAIYQSDIQNYSTLHMMTDKDEVAPGSSTWVMFDLELKPGWYTYWENPGDSGLPPELTTQLPPGFSLTKLQFKLPKIIKVGDLVDYGYYDHAYIFTQLNIDANVKSGTYPIEMQMNWVTCNDLCIPQTGSVRFDLQVGKDIVSNDSDMIKGQLADLPTQTVAASLVKQAEKIQIQLPFTDTLLKEPFIYVAPKDSVASLHKQQWSVDGKSLIFEMDTGLNPSDRLHGLVKLNNTEVIQFVAQADGSVAATSHTINLGLAIGFALLGGLLLNIMPCVFPILALKLVSLTKLGQHAWRPRALHAFCYSAGILVAFLVFAAVVIGLADFGHAVGWGFQMQSPVFVAVMSYVMFLVALNLFGWFEFILPIAINVKQDNGHFKSSFYTGLLITVLATPCSAPFMAPAIGFALAQAASTILLIFVSLGLGLALPFVVFALIPILCKALPKPGRWLVTFKQILAFPMLLTTAWLLWLLSKIAPSNFVGITLLGLCLLGFVVWMHYHRYLGKRLHWLVAVLVLVMLAFSSTQLPQEQATQTTFARAQLDELVNDSHVLVNVTADWCLTCKVNEPVLHTDQVQAYLQQHDIKLMTIDWTKPNHEVTLYLQRFGRSGVPLYVFYEQGKAPKVLPQWLTPGMITTLLDEP